MKLLVGMRYWLCLCVGLSSAGAASGQFMTMSSLPPMAVLGQQPSSDELETLSSIYPDDEEVKAAIKAVILDRCQRAQAIAADQSFEIAYTNNVGRFILVVVHLILGIALYCSWKEFAAANRLRAMASNAAPTVQEITISTEGLALKTSLQGTLLLLIALGFYFLYLKYVFPVAVVDSSGSF